MTSKRLLSNKIATLQHLDLSKLTAIRDQHANFVTMAPGNSPGYAALQKTHDPRLVMQSTWLRDRYWYDSSWQGLTPGESSTGAGNSWFQRWGSFPNYHMSADLAQTKPSVLRPDGKSMGLYPSIGLVSLLPTMIVWGTELVRFKFMANKVASVTSLWQVCPVCFFVWQKTRRQQELSSECKTDKLQLCLLLSLWPALLWWQPCVVALVSSILVASFSKPHSFPVPFWRFHWPSCSIAFLRQSLWRPVVWPNWQQSWP